MSSICDACRRVLEEIQKQPIHNGESKINHHASLEEIQKQPIHNGESKINHHASLEDLRNASKKGCLICKRVDTKVSGEWAPSLSDCPTVVEPLHLRWKDSPSDCVLELTFTLRNSTTRCTQILSLAFKPVDAENDRLQIPRIVHGYRPSNVVGGAGAMALARHWIRTCDEHHILCKRPPVKDCPNWRPTRLIYVGVSDTPPRLVHGEDLPDEIEYVTLSHCWGKLDSRLILTEANVRDWSTRLPSMNEWKTFADAMVVARSLGFSYIWIDSLCIIQDSVTDWQRECPLMSNVYRRSSCNIAATAARDDTEGCFWERDIDVDLPLRIHFSNSVSPMDREGIMITANGNKESRLFGSYDVLDTYWYWSVHSSVLNRRGWVLQERMIAPRVLNFTKEELYWECDELQASESHPYGGLPSQWPAVPGDFVPSFKSLNPFHLSSLALEDRHKRAFEIWDQAVKAFSRASLTKASDKLVAISAIARELQPFLGCRYLAGLWERDLLRQLAWVSGRRAWDRPDVYIAPSWSWASLDISIKKFIDLQGYDNDRGTAWQALVDIMDVDVDLKFDDAMGQVKSGFLKLCGKLHPISIDCWRGYVGFMEGCSAHLSIHLDNTGSWKWPARYTALCLPISMSFTASYTDIDYFQCILLDQVEANETYRRIGYMKGTFYQTPKPAEDSILIAAGVTRDGEHGRFNVERQTTGMQTITII